MKHSITLLLPLALLVASCGSAAWLNPRQTFQDGIYYKPQSQAVNVLTEEDFQKIAAERIAQELKERKDSLEQAEAVAEQINNITVNIVDPWYSSWHGGWYNPWFYGYGWYNSAWYWNHWHWADWYWFDPYFDFWYSPWYYGGWGIGWGFGYYPYGFGYGYGYPWYYGGYYPWHGYYPGGGGYVDSRPYIRQNRNDYNFSRRSGVSSTMSRSSLVTGSGVSGSGRYTPSKTSSGGKVVVGGYTGSSTRNSSPSIRLNSSGTSSGSSYNRPNAASSARGSGSFSNGTSRSTSSSSYSAPRSNSSYSAPRSSGGSYGGGAAIMYCVASLWAHGLECARLGLTLKLQML